jgi:hypothetical protein
MATAEETLLCYRMLMGRSPTPYETARAAAWPLPELREALLRTPELVGKVLYRHFAEDAGGEIARRTQAMQAYLDGVGPDRLAALQGWIQALPQHVDPATGHNYVQFHAQRILELLAFVARRHQDRPILRLLDVGLSPFFGLYRRLLPDAHCALADIWAHTPVAVRAAGADAFFRVDLNASGVSEAHGGSLAGQRFDLVVFTEVAEHLLADPAESFADLLELLEPHGLLYCSTPNYFHAGNLGKLLERRNPQARFSRKVGNATAHYHLREYSVQELLQAVALAGGVVQQMMLSDCWDRANLPPKKLAALPVTLRSNVVMVISRAEGLRAAQPVSRDDDDPGRRDFDEQWYLQSHPDVAAAVREGRFRSGWAHFDACGRREGRLWRSPGAPPGPAPASAPRR